MNITLGTANITIVGLVGLILFLLGFFFIVAGLGIIKIEKVVIQSGRKTWVAGLLALALGAVLIGLDVNPPEKEAEPAPAQPTATVLPSATLPPPPATPTPTPPISTGYPTYAANFETLDTALWCEIPGGEKTGGGFLEVTADAQSGDVRYELKPCRADNLQWVEVSLQVTGASHADQSNHAGLQVGLADGRYLYFSLDGSGAAFIEQGAPDRLLDPALIWRGEPGGLDQVRHFRLEWTGSEVRAFLDGDLAAALPAEGPGEWFLLHVTAYQGRSMQVQFDDAAWKMP